MSSSCLICDRIDAIRKGTNRLLVTELSTGYVVLGDFQFWKGYTLFLHKQHVCELHELDSQARMQFLEEMSAVAGAVYRAFHPRKLNYELLGNSEPHLHWHLFPRYDDEPMPQQPVWLVDKSIRYAESARPTDSHVNEMKAKILDELSARR